MLRRVCSRINVKESTSLFRKAFSISSAATMPIKVGDKLPSIELMENTPTNTVNIADLFKDKTGIVFAVPGAFTPGCSKTHLPGFVNDVDALKSKGIDLVVCVSVNDPFVMESWGKAMNATGKIRMLADTCCKFTKAIDLELDATPILGNVRSKRYSMVVKNGEVTKINVEPDGTGLSSSLSKELLKQL